MRRIYRLVGGIRFFVGVTVVLTSFALQNALGEVWTGLLVLCGAVIGVSGLVGVLLLIAFYILLPIAIFSAEWLIFDSWNEQPISEALERNLILIKFYWAVGLVCTPLAIWQLNQSWFFMVRHFAIDDKPSDTRHPELFATGVIRVTDSTYIGAVTIAEEGLIIDRRNHSPVIIPWKWVTSVDPGDHSSPDYPSANVQVKNSDNELLTLEVPWNEDLLRLNRARLDRPSV